MFAKLVRKSVRKSVRASNPYLVGQTLSNLTGSAIRVTVRNHGRAFRGVPFCHCSPNAESGCASSTKGSTTQLRIVVDGDAQLKHLVAAEKSCSLDMSTETTTTTTTGACAVACVFNGVKAAL